MPFALTFCYLTQWATAAFAFYAQMHYITKSVLINYKKKSSFGQTFLIVFAVGWWWWCLCLGRSCSFAALPPVVPVKRHRRLNLTLQNSSKASYITTPGCFGFLLISHGAQHAAAICCSRWMRYPGNSAKAAGPFPHKLEHVSNRRFKQNNTPSAQSSLKQSKTAVIFTSSNNEKEQSSLK